MKTLPFIALAALVQAYAADITGKWKSEFDTQIGRMKYTYDLKADGEKLTGKAIRILDGEKLTTDLTEGKVKDDSVEFIEIIHVDDREIRIQYKGKIAGDQIKFTREVGDFATMQILADREKHSEIPFAGRWQAEFDTQIGKQKYVYTLNADGANLAGKANAEIGGEKYETVLKDIKVIDNQITFLEPLHFQDNDLQITYEGKISGDQIKFTRHVGEVAREQFTAIRAAK